jgi:hypothetical protein
MEQAVHPGLGFDLVVEAYPRSGNTFLVAAIRAAWPHLLVKSHIHNPDHVHTADGSVPVITLARNPIEAVASTSVILSTFPKRIAESEDLILLIGRYSNMLSAAARNPHVLVIPFPALIENVNKVLEVIGKKYGLGPQAVTKTNSEILDLTHRISSIASKDQDEFLKRGNVPREKSPMYYEVLERLSLPEYSNKIAELNRLYEGVIAPYYSENK